MHGFENQEQIHMKAELWNKDRVCINCLEVKIMFFDIDEYDNMTEEEIDAFFRPKKKNNRKSLLPLFVYLILKDHSNFNHPLQQQDIIDYLAANPYEIEVERKAVGRVIHSLEDSGLGIHSEHKYGNWFEQ